jgi:hypothetical protein
MLLNKSYSYQGCYASISGSGAYAADSAKGGWNITL